MGDYKTLINDMGVGFNYGNVYDCFDMSARLTAPVTWTGVETGPPTGTVEQYDKTWQAYVIMSTDGETLWEASNNIQEQDGVINISHDVSNSSQTGNMKTLSIQLINHALITHEKSFNVNVSIKWNGEEIYNENSELLLSNHVTQYIAADLTNLNSLPAGIFDVTITFLSRPDSEIVDVTLPNQNDNESYNMWGNTKLNEVVIEMLRDEGFKTIRLPVTWSTHTDHNGKIDDEWMNEIQRAVDIILNNGMYCILDVHHDTGELGWLVADIDKVTTMSEKLSGLWMQIGERFKDYGDKLIFEGFNEILNSNNQWSWMDDSCHVAVQALNQAFIDTVRSIGSNNANRWLICNAYATNHEDYGNGTSMVDGYLLPTDPANKFLVQYHVYANLANSIVILDRIHARFDTENIGVVIGEWGMQASSADTDTRNAYAYGFVKHCKELGILCAWWDDGGSNQEDPSTVYNFGLIGKGMANVWWYKSIADHMMLAWNETSSPDIPDIPDIPTPVDGKGSSPALLLRRRILLNRINK